MGIVIVGMGARQVNLLEMVFAGPGGSCCVVAPDERAQACILDLDSSGAVEELLRQRQLHPRRPLMLTARNRPAEALIGPDLFVRKPLRVDALVDAVLTLRARAWGPFPVEGQASPVPRAMPDPSVPAEPPSRQPSPPEHPPPSPRVVHVSTYEPARYLQGLVDGARREALQRGCAVHLEGPWPTITLLPSCGTAVVPGGAVALRPFSLQYDLPSHGRVTFTPAPLFSPHHPDAVDLEALLWDLALGASAGRVPDGTPLDGLCALQDWPNFTRLAPTPGAMSIAALWTRQTITLEQTACALQIPLREVCSFYSAAHAVGLITPASDVAPASPDAAMVAPSPRRGLLRRVFETLHSAGEWTT